MPSERIGRTITAIKEDRSRHIVVVFGKDKLVLTQDTATEIPLYVGKTLTDREFHYLETLAKNAKLYQYALTLSAKGAYSAHDIRTKLLNKSEDTKLVAAIVHRLIDAGLLDDVAFAEQYQREKEYALYGKNRIRDDLRYKHGISEDIITSLVFKHEEEKANRYLQTQERHYSSLPLRRKQMKAFDALIRRGFDQKTAQNAAILLKEDPKKKKEELRKTAATALSKYQKKFDGYELRSHVYQYLLRKGYDTSDINIILEDLI